MRRRRKVHFRWSREAAIRSQRRFCTQPGQSVVRLHTMRLHNESLCGKARALRRRATSSEMILWDALRNRRFLGVKFRRQHTLGSFIVDFYAASHHLVIEIDGAAHEGLEDRDQARDRYLASNGLRVLRLAARDVECNLLFALAEIARVLKLEAVENPHTP